ncbi:MAG: nicotinate (nicotinamide) nucleotide adenylyltransferase [Clostridia bacterium]|nr:nicotinate (nicotinamide) nucleotide adenylyltransferase [Clostridia bacterium]
MSKIGLYGGSFNPPTKAHIELAKKVIKECNLDKVIFVPVGDLYQKEGMAKGIHRYNMLKIASIREDNLQVSDIEIRENKNYKTIEIFEILRNEYKKEDVYFIMGADNLEKLPFWHESNRLVSNYKYIILDRGLRKTKDIIENNVLLKKNEKRFTIINNVEFNDCSSTKIREQIKKEENPENLDDGVYSYIRENNIY